jgi:exonuclease III
VANLKYHFDNIKSDFAMTSADILLFAECHTKPTDINQLALNDYNIIHLSGSNNANASNGLACYVKKSLTNRTNFILDNSTNGYYNSSSGVELALMTLQLPNNGTLYICFLYNHPSNSFASFWQSFKDFLTTNIPNARNKNLAPPILIFGDFNFNLLQRKTISDENLNKFLSKFALKFTNLSKSTTDRETLIDWCLSNAEGKNKMKFFVYESYFSDHKPLWLYLENN